MILNYHISSFQELCFGDYRFEVLLKSYKNPTHKHADGSCCDGSLGNSCAASKVVCGGLFTFCIRPHGYHAKERSHPCPTPRENFTTTDIAGEHSYTMSWDIADDSISFSDGQLLNPATNLSNPLVFRLKSWPVSAINY